MTGGVEGIGEAVTGGMIARAVEPEAGEAHEVGAGTKCLNCGTPLVGSYCHHCGQAAHVHRTLSAFFHDLAHSVLHFDGKIWRTLPLLALSPGELTRRYIEGERARFVSPMALFLFSVLLMFAVFTMIGGPFTSIRAMDRAEIAEGIAPERERLQKALINFRSERQALVASGRSTVEVDEKISDAERALKALNATARITGGNAVSGTEKAAASSNEGGDINITTGFPPLDSALKKAGENPKLLLYKVQTNAYKFSWALIPISVPFVWLMFLHRRRYWQYGAYDHTIFVTYSIAFMSISVIVLSILRPLGLSDGWVGAAIAFIPPIHMYRQLRGAYRLSRLSALWRTMLLLIFAIIAGSLFTALLFTLGALA